MERGQSGGHRTQGRVEEKQNQHPVTRGLSTSIMIYSYVEVSTVLWY